LGSRFVLSLLGSFLVTLAVLVGAGLLITAFAVRTPRDPFRAGSFEFDLAPGWWCEFEDNAYVCSPAGKPPYSAIVVMAIKERNNNDTLAAYEKHLTEPQRQKNSRDGGEQSSEVRYVKRRILGEHEWVESLHVGSEVPDYETYYLGTVTSYLGILVTMSVHKDHTAEYIRQLDDMMSTLNVYQR
jgi:hypothetical protein